MIKKKNAVKRSQKCQKMSGTVLQQISELFNAILQKGNYPGKYNHYLIIPVFKRELRKKRNAVRYNNNKYFR